MLSRVWANPVQACSRRWILCAFGGLPVWQKRLRTIRLDDFSSLSSLNELLLSSTTIFTVLRFRCCGDVSACREWSSCSENSFPGPPGPCCHRQRGFLNPDDWQGKWEVTCICLAASPLMQARYDVSKMESTGTREKSLDDRFRSWL